MEGGQEVVGFRDVMRAAREAVREAAGGSRQQGGQVLADRLVQVYCRAVEEAQAALPKNIGPEDSRRIAQGLASCVHQDFGSAIGSIAGRPGERHSLLRQVEQAYRQWVGWRRFGSESTPWWCPEILCFGIPNDDTVRAVA
ncbi:hypothetical protein L6258_00625 [Candidatus Parcubacteria bacterium]|nr:hypothetical protein [Candidatus Parcubacteria bacterium]